MKPKLFGPPDGGNFFLWIKWTQSNSFWGPIWFRGCSSQCISVHKLCSEWTTFF